MSASDRAVFLSYASQDAPTAQRICEALRAAGVEVWFDQNELVGGDAWDSKIRRQIAECALFVPIISANTQARTEGYFRLEWKLAAQRTHMIADDAAFLLPVVIDDTRDTEARVPGEFKAVQWTRLRPAGYAGQARQGGEAGDDASGAFCERVKKLLGGSEMNPAGGGDLRPDRPTVSRREAAPTAGRRARWLLPALGGVVVLVALAWWPPWRVPGAAQPVAAPAPAARSEAPASPLREWVAKARALYEPFDLATAEDFRQAEALLQRALQLDPTDVEALASQAILSCGMYVIPHDPTPERMREARHRAEMALKLAPQSDYALLAYAFALRLPAETEEEGIRLLRQLVARNPRNKMMLRVLGAPLSRKAATMDEGLELLARAAALPGGDPLAEYLRGEALARRTTRYAEAIAAFDRAIALAPNYPDAHKEKIATLLERMANPEAARAALEQVPATLLLDARVILVGYKVAMACDDSNRALRMLAEASPYIITDLFAGPSGYFKGLAHRRAGRKPAADIEWRAAMEEIQKRLAKKPTDPSELLWKAVLHGLLGERENMAAAFELHQQFAAGAQGGALRHGLGELVKAMLATPDEAIALTKARLAHRSSLVRRLASAAVLFDPAFDPWRKHPEFPVLVESARAELAAQDGKGAAK